MSIKNLKKIIAPKIQLAPLHLGEVVDIASEAHFRPRAIGLGVSVPGIGHSDIRGLVTYRSMVRRELYRLFAWITDFSAPT